MMSVEASSWVWNHSQAKGIARLVLLRIADQADKTGANAWPGLELIRKDCGIAKQGTTRDAIKSLVDLGELVVYANAGGDKYTRNDRRPNRYDLPLVPGYETPSWAARSTTLPTEGGRELSGDDPTTSPPRANDLPSQGERPPLPGGTTSPPRGGDPSLIHPDPSTDPPVVADADDDEAGTVVNFMDGKGSPNAPFCNPQTPTEVELVRLAEAEQVAKFLARRVADAAGTKPKPPSGSSVAEIEKMIRIDGIPAAKILRMVTWLHESDCEDAVFWRSNVLSGKKLREKWPTLAMKANAAPRRSRVQQVQHTNQMLLLQASQKIAAEDEARRLNERALREADDGWLDGGLAEIGQVWS